MAEEVDIDKVHEFIDARVKEQISDYFRQQEQQQQQQVTPDQAQVQLREYIAPALQPEMNRVGQAEFTAADAKDYAQFYYKNADAMEYQDEVEKLFQEAKDNGRPMKREALLHYIRGKEYATDRDKFIEKATAKHKAQLAAAGDAADFGGSGVNRERAEGEIDNINNLIKEGKLDEAASLLEGVTF